MFTRSLPLAEIAHQLRNNEIDLLDFINQLCNRIVLIEPEIHSLIPEAKRRDRLLNEAEILLAKYPDKNHRPPFYGIPIGVKDIFNVNGFQTRCGSALPAELFEGHEASCVSKLKAAGALILGKTVTTEFAYFEPGPTRNPNNINYTPGGSSSGSAAAVATGLTPFAFGTQTIGSIIRPAAYCGIIGFKPSYGRISTDGIIPFSQSADHVGFFTQDIEGCIIAAALLCNDWNFSQLDEQFKKPFVIGVPEGKYLSQASDEILSAFENQLKILEEQGVQIIKVKSFDTIEETNRLLKLMIAAEMAEVHKDWIVKYESLYRPRTKEIISDGQKVNNEELEFSKEERFRLRKEIESLKASSGIDLWVAPATITTPSEGISSTGSPLMNLPWTYSGLPTITIPAGKNSEGLPIGLQFIGSFNEDEKMLSIMKKINNWFR